MNIKSRKIKNFIYILLILAFKFSFFLFLEIIFYTKTTSNNELIIEISKYLISIVVLMIFLKIFLKENLKYEIIHNNFKLKSLKNYNIAWLVIIYLLIRGDYSNPNYIAKLFIFSIFVAIFEEIMYHGIIYNLLNTYGHKCAIIGSSILFTLIHINSLILDFQSLLHLITMFSLIIYFTVLRFKWDSIVPGIIMHALYDFSVFVSMSTEGTLFTSIYQIFFLIYAFSEYKKFMRGDCLEYNYNTRKVEFYSENKMYYVNYNGRWSNK